MNAVKDFASGVDVNKRKKLDINAGNTIRVWVKIQEKGKTRLQAFEGLVISRKHGSEPGATFTVRKMSGGMGIERIFPLYSPIIDKIEKIKDSKVRRSKLYYIRDKATKEIRRKMKKTKVVDERMDTGSMNDKDIVKEEAEEDKKVEAQVMER